MAKRTKTPDTRTIHTLIASGALLNAEASAGVERLRCLGEARAAIEDELRGQVRDMRDGGATWREIGEALGVTRSAAQQRYAD